MKGPFFFVMILLLAAFVSCKEENSNRILISQAEGSSRTNTLTIISITASSQLEKKTREKRYAPVNIIDGEVKTVWAEGVEGDGRGEWIYLEAEYGCSVDTVVIYPGFFKEGYFKKNARPRRIRLTIGFTERIISIPDKMERVVVKLGDSVPLTQMKLTVLEVYSESRWKDLCISEMEFYNRGDKITIVLREESADKGGAIIPAVDLNKKFTPVRIDKLLTRIRGASYRINPKIHYPLPLDINKIRNREVMDYMTRSVKEDRVRTLTALMRKNGFVVIRYPHGMDMNIYDWVGETPNFITTDSLLHGYHVQFIELLKNIEESEFYQDIYTITYTLAQHFNRRRQDAESNELRDAVNLAAMFFYTCARIINPELKIPEDIAARVNDEVKKIVNATGYVQSSLFKYQIPYNLFKPRGHYTKSLQLKRYFMVMNYLGNASFAFNQLPLMEKRDIAIQATAALMICDAMMLRKRVLGLWERLYSVTSFLVGESDDYNIYDLDSVGKKKLSGYGFKRLLSADEIDAIREGLLEIRKPRIYSGTGNLENLQAPSGKLKKVLEGSVGFRFMGARLVPDAEITQLLMTPSVGKFTGRGTPFTLQRTPLPNGDRVRGYAMGLDIMAVFGSETARRILESRGETAFDSYDKNFRRLRKRFSSEGIPFWDKTVYKAWLYSLFPLIDVIDGPTFMATEAWRMKSLNTALASWAELRHDTILYVKQPFAAEMGGPDVQYARGYVEPLPEFYLRLKYLVDMTEKGLSQFNLIPQENRKALSRFSSELQRFYDISLKELRNEELTKSEYSFIQDYRISYLHPKWELSDDKDTPIIADVMTNGMDGLCVEEGVGYVNILYAAYKLPSGEIFVGRGPVFSYHEFKQSMNNRLTDEQWKILLQEDHYRDIPEWTNSFAISSK
jgi:hypothetical protein